MAKTKKEKSKKSVFANIIIVLCVTIGAIVTAVTLFEYHRLDMPMPADVILAIMGLWGGELLIVALRQIFGTDVTRRKDSDV